jgi:hypothetical protein
LFVNGQKFEGDRRIRELAFGEHPRIYVQAAAKGYEPKTEWFTRQQIEELLSRGEDLRITLEPR